VSASSPIIGQVFGHYRLLEQIGAGGMGVVFRAHDEQLQRDVAVKILPHDLLSDPARRERFRKEALVVGRLNHPNLAMAFDFGAENGIDYLVTEYIPGVNLDEKIGGQPLPQKTVLELAIQMMNGLEAAHRADVIHRDLKPGNIRISSDGQVKILDFGLAKLTGPIDAGAATATLDGELSVSGTLPYMAPELVRAEPSDARADIWAAGAVLYEMATGRRAFPDKQPSLVIDAILHYDPVRPTLLNAAITPPLEAVILKALDRDRARRYQSARELRVDLERILAGDQVATDTLRHAQAVQLASRSRRRKLMALTVVAVLAVLAVFFAANRWRLQPAGAGQNVLAVLPIETVGQDSATNALGLGLTETLTAKLEQASGSDAMQVVSPRDLRDQNIKTAEEARREFGTDYVLESSLQKSGQMIRINCYLVDSKTHRQLAARTIETAAGDTFKLQDEVVNAALDMLPGHIKAAQREALAVRQDTQPAAYEAYIRGRGYLQEYEKPENIDSAITAFDQALKVDPNYAPAYAGLGEGYWLGYDRLDRGAEWVSKASDNCKKSLVLNPDLVEGHVCLGNLFRGTGKYAEAVQEFQRALASDPQDDNALRGLAESFTSLGKFTEAESTYKNAIALRPNYGGGYHDLGLFYYSQARYADAVAMFRKLTEIAPDNSNGYMLLGGGYVTLGRYADAIQAFERSIALRPDADAYGNLGYTYTLMHRYPEAIASLQQALKLHASLWEIWGNLADALYWSPQRRSEAAANYQQAISLAKAKLQVNPKDSEVLAYLADYSAMLGERENALDFLHQAQQAAPTDAEVLFRSAIVYNHFGETEQALAYLKKAADAGYSRAIIKDTPDFAALQQNPQFAALIDKP
jgi:eukaryotic-like serine/threonine-protein kinase